MRSCARAALIIAGGCGGGKPVGELRPQASAIDARSTMCESLELAVNVSSMPHGGTRNLAIDARGQVTQLNEIPRIVNEDDPDVPAPGPQTWSLSPEAHAQLRRALLAVPLDSLPAYQRADVRDGLFVSVTWTCDGVPREALAGNVFPPALGRVMDILRAQAYPPGAPASELPTGANLAEISRTFDGVPVQRTRAP